MGIRPLDISQNLQAQGQLAQVNALNVQRRQQAEARRDARRQGRIGNVLGVAGAIAGGVATGGSPQGIAGGFALGRTVGGGLAGGQVDPGVVLSGGAAIAGAQQQSAALEAQEARTSALQSALNPAPIIDETGRQVPGQVSRAEVTAALAADPRTQGIAGQLALGGQGRQRGQVALGTIQTIDTVVKGVQGTQRQRATERGFENVGAFVPTPPKGGGKEALFDVLDARGDIIESGVTRSEIPAIRGSNLGTERVVPIGRPAAPSQAQPKSTERSRAFDGLNEIAPLIANNTATPKQQAAYRRDFSILSTPTRGPDGSVVPGQPLTQLGFPPPTRFAGGGAPAPGAVDVGAAFPRRKAQLKSKERAGLRKSIEGRDLVRDVRNNLGAFGETAFSPQGIFSAIGAFTGMDDRAVAVKAASDRLKIALRETFRGQGQISDKEQALVDNLGIAFTQGGFFSTPRNVIETRLKHHEAAFDAQISGEEDYLRKNGFAITNELFSAAEESSLPPEGLIMKNGERLREVDIELIMQEEGFTTRAQVFDALRKAKALF